MRGLVNREGMPDSWPRSATDSRDSAEEEEHLLMGAFDNVNNKLSSASRRYLDVEMLRSILVVKLFQLIYIDIFKLRKPIGFLLIFVTKVRCSLGLGLKPQGLGSAHIWPSRLTRTHKQSTHSIF